MKKFNLITGFSLALFVLFLASSAHALDAYKDRRGFFAGFGGAGGVAFQGDENGFGGGGGLYLGGGATQDFTIEVDIDVMYYTLDPGALTLMAGPRAAYFVWEGLYLRPGVDFGWFHTEDVDDMGIGAEFGIGYEVFFNSDAAGSLGLKYEHIFIIDDPDIDMVGMTAEIRWY